MINIKWMNLIKKIKFSNWVKQMNIKVNLQRNFIIKNNRVAAISNLDLQQAPNIMISNRINIKTIIFVIALQIKFKYSTDI